MKPISSGTALTPRVPPTLKIKACKEIETPPDRFEGGREFLDKASRVYTEYASMAGGAKVGGQLGINIGLAAATFVGATAAASAIPGFAIVGGIGLVGAITGGYLGHKVSGSINEEIGKLGEKLGSKFKGASKWMKTGIKAAGALALTAASGLSVPLTLGVMATAGAIGAAVAKPQIHEKSIEVKEQPLRQTLFEGLDPKVQGNIMAGKTKEVKFYFER